MHSVVATGWSITLLTFSPLWTVPIRNQSPVQRARKMILVNKPRILVTCRFPLERISSWQQFLAPGCTLRALQFSIITKITLMTRTREGMAATWRIVMCMAIHKRDGTESKRHKKLAVSDKTHDLTKNYFPISYHLHFLQPQ